MTGKIVESKVIHSRDYDDTSIRYRYVVDGRTYEARRVEFGYTTLGSGGVAKGNIKKMSRRQDVAVYYKPDDPGTAVLKPGTAQAQKMLYLSGGAVVAAVIVLLCTAKALKTKQKSALE